MYPNAEGIVTVELPSNIATDDAGNLNVGSNVLSFLWDTTHPTPIFNSTEPTITSNYPFPLNLTFSELVTGLVIDDIVVTGIGGGIQDCFAWNVSQEWDPCDTHLGCVRMLRTPSHPEQLVF